MKNQDPPETIFSNFQYSMDFQKVVSDSWNVTQAGFTSLAHTDEDIEATIQAAREVFAEI